MLDLIKHRYLFLIIVMSILIFPFLNRGLLESSEGRYAQVAKTMNESGDYWIPKLDHHPHLTKPPITYWVIASGLKIFGNSNVGARFFHGCFWILLTLMIIRIGELTWGREMGLIAGLIFATSFLTTLGSESLTTDPILFSFQTLSFLSLIEYQQKKTLLWSGLFWIGLGLALSTKGPVGLFPVCFWIFFFKNDFKNLLKTHLWVLTILFGSFWYIGLEIQNPGMIVHLIQDEIIKRSTTDFSGRNPFWWAPFAIYVLPLIFGWGLWPLLFSRKKVTHLDKLYLSWIFLTLIFFSFIQSRLILYILPLSLPVTLLLARFIQRSRWVSATFGISFLLILSIKVFFTYFYFSDQDAQKIAAFINKTTTEKVILFNEKLYGVEFYLGNQVIRLVNEQTIYQGITNPKVHWIFYRKKQTEHLKKVLGHFQEDIAPKGSFGKWVMATVEKKDSPKRDFANQSQ